MKQVSPWLNPLAMLAAATLTWANPASAREVNPTATATFNPNGSSIEIFVPPPEMPETPEIPATPANPAIPNSRICPAELGPAINAIIDKPPLKTARWGVLVESLNDGTVFYSKNADTYLIPASNVKLLTTAAILQRLEPQTPIRSKSLREWVSVTNLRSNNAYAETLLRYMGGSKAARQALTQLGIDPNSYRQVDGSGLSRQNAATPRALVNILRAMYVAPAREVFLASLPVAGVSGTLRNRLRQTPAQGIVSAKTGTLTGVRALSGYLTHPDYGTLVFSIIANQPRTSGQALVKGIDRIVLQLSRLNRCE